ncbi:MAG: FAD/NAD(P)-binding oxidoreductase [Gemmatimonadales bacterium]
MSERRRVDIVVVGAGPAGLAAAAAAAARGRRVLVIDQGLRPGGQVWRHQSEAELPARARTLMVRARNAGATFAAEARVVDINSAHELIVDFRGRIAPVGTESIVLATGARERFLPFPGWTLPGVMGVGGLQALYKSGLRMTGKRIVIGGTGPLLLPVAAALAHAGADVRFVAEQAGAAALLRFGASLGFSPAKLLEGARYRGAFLSTPYRTNSWIVAAAGEGRLRSVTVQTGKRQVEFDCDFAAAAMGLVPNAELAQLLGCVMQDDAIGVGALQETSVAGVFAAGECTGVKGDDAGIAEGEIAGAAAAGDLRAARHAALVSRRDAGRRFGARLATTFAPRREVLTLAAPDTILCRCEDVACGAIQPEWSQRQAKLWTRVGMGVCQGAVCGPACSAMFGWQGNAVRPPLHSPAVGGWSESLTHEG